MYAPAIAYDVDEVAKFCERYGIAHWVAAKRTLKYLKTTQDIGIMFSGTNKRELIGYADANWAGGPRHATFQRLDTNFF